jgi:hypothetical protein
MQQNILTPDQLSRVEDWTMNSGPDGNCIEVGTVDGMVAVRDDQYPDTALGFTSADFGTFLEGAKAGKFDKFVSQA